jgi:hypothetical protein
MDQLDLAFPISLLVLIESSFQKPVLDVTGKRLPIVGPGCSLKASLPTPSLLPFLWFLKIVDIRRL